MGRASNNGNITGSTTQTLSQPIINSTVKLEPTTNSPLIQAPSNVTVSSSNQSPNSLPIKNPQSTDNNALITTTNVILDYLLFLSINARIDQTKNELLKDVAKGQQQLPSFNNKKGQGVEAIVGGLLQSHRTQASSSMLLPLPLKHRLYLCQLLHLVFDRSQIAISGSSPSKSSQITQNSTNPPKSTTSSSKSTNTTNMTNTATNTTTNAINMLNTANMTNTTNTTTMTNTINSINTSRNNNNSQQKQRAQKLPTNLAKYEKHFKNALLSRCRKHRQSICSECQQHPSNSSITPPMTRRRSTPPKPIPTRRTAPGLIDAIPVFLNTCAITYRLARDNEPMTVKPMWYELLLDLLTQAVIECYLCDSYKSIDALLEVFSYGDIDPSDYHSDDSESDDDDPQFAATRADDYLLWQRTAYLDEFRQKKKDRMDEFLNVKGKLEQHFENLANKYPIRKFETEMLNYCADVTGSLETPALMTGNKSHKNNSELSNELFHIPGRYCGGIDIPMSDDDDDDDFNVMKNTNCNGNSSQSDNNNMDGKKRRLSESDKSKEIIKKTKSEEVSS